MRPLQQKGRAAVQSVQKALFHKLGRLYALPARQASTAPLWGEKHVSYAALGSMGMLSGQTQAERAFHVTEELTP